MAGRYRRDQAGLDITPIDEAPVVVDAADEGGSDSRADRGERGLVALFRSQFAQIVLGGVAGILIVAPLIAMLHSRGQEGESPAQRGVRAVIRAITWQWSPGRAVLQPPPDYARPASCAGRPPGASSRN